jgi:hypothetical protein
MYIHGKRKTRAYHIWKGIKHRCLNPQSKSYKDYGGRGIIVCDRWLDFVNFYADMGDPPEGLEIDRIDNSRGYEPSNCRWVTRKANCHNRRKRNPHYHDGEKNPSAKLTDLIVLQIKLEYSRGLKSYSMLSKEYGVTPSTVQDLVKGRTWKHLPLFHDPPRKKHQPFSEWEE